MTTELIGTLEVHNLKDNNVKTHSATSEHGQVLWEFLGSPRVSFARCPSLRMASVHLELSIK